MKIGFTPSPNDEFIFFRKDVIFSFMLMMGFLSAPKQKNRNKAIRDLEDKNKAKQYFNIEDQGEIIDYLGINFNTLEDRSLKLWQHT